MSKKYFNEDVDEAILKFQQSNDKKEKELLCKNFILPAFEKLATYHYHRVPIRKNEEVIYDCVADLYEKIPMYNKDKSTHAFAYFNMIARNFIFQKLKKEKKEVNQEEEISLNHDSSVLLNDSLVDDELEINIEKNEFFELLKQQLPKWKEKAEKEQEKEIIDALIVLFENIDNIDIYKKKAIFFYIKELTQEKLNSKQVALNLNKIKKKFLIFKKKYQKGEI